MGKKLAIGDSASITTTFTAEDVDRFAELSHDKNPIHFRTH
jgi:acyl dehydratase